MTIKDDIALLRNALESARHCYRTHIKISSGEWDYKIKPAISVLDRIEAALTKPAVVKLESVPEQKPSNIEVLLTPTADGREALSRAEYILTHIDPVMFHGCKREIFEVIELILSARGLIAQEWQPIDTAPRDIPILGCVADKNIIDIIQLDAPVDWRYIDPPTHWMPLPPAQTSKTDVGS